MNTAQESVVPLILLQMNLKAVTRVTKRLPPPTYCTSTPAPCAASAPSVRYKHMIGITGMLFCDSLKHFQCQRKCLQYSAVTLVRQGIINTNYVPSLAPSTVLVPVKSVPVRSERSRNTVTAAR